jgi:hypothetical protein
VKDEHMPETGEEMQESQEKEQQMDFDVRRAPRTRSNTFASVYANHTQASTNFWDLRLFFGEIVFAPGTDPPGQVQEHVCVTMSWEHAKAVHALLGRMIEAYEKSHGATAIRKQPDTIEVRV